MYTISLQGKSFLQIFPETLEFCEDLFQDCHDRNHNLTSSFAIGVRVWQHRLEFCLSLIAHFVFAYACLLL
jgi:hypothetical protein